MFFMDTVYFQYTLNVCLKKLRKTIDCEVCGKKFGKNGDLGGTHQKKFI
jgi:hypothetical protein